MRLTRRAMLAGAASSMATLAGAEAPLTSMRPIARIPAQDVITNLVANADLTGNMGVVVVDVSTGDVVEEILGNLEQPPASVAKAFTALYALDTLGVGHSFKTRIFADDLVKDGILDGNLILAGGGDPNLVTDELAMLARTLKETGLREVKGDFLVWDEALRNLDEIDSGQLDYIGYNPTITGLNLNYNRVHFEWKRNGNDFTTAMDARSENYRPEVTVSRVRLVDRDSPVFSYRDDGDVDRWTVARSALNNAGSRWLPVRHPALYAGEVFATFMRSHGVVLKAPKETSAAPQGDAIATYESAPLPEMMRAMLRYSTNITAEAAGLMATKARVGERYGLRASAAGMARWMRSRCGGVMPRFVDHSGLGDMSRVTPNDMVQMLTSPDVQATLEPIMRNIRLVDSNGDRIERGQARVRAKTGTLNFVSTLAGYVRTSEGRDLAFAIFASDLEARAVGKASGDEQPRGSVSWNRRARALQQDILQHLALRLPD